MCERVPRQDRSVRPRWIAENIASGAPHLEGRPDRPRSNAHHGVRARGQRSFVPSKRRQRPGDLERGAAAWPFLLGPMKRDARRVLPSEMGPERKTKAIQQTCRNREPDDRFLDDIREHNDRKAPDRANRPPQAERPRSSFLRSAFHKTWGVRTGKLPAPGRTACRSPVAQACS